MGIFSKKVKSSPAIDNAEQAALAELVLNYLTEGVVIVDANGLVQIINPAAQTMCELKSLEAVVGFDFLLNFKFENGEGMAIDEGSNLVLKAIREGSGLQLRDYVIVTTTNQRRPVAITVIPAGQQRIITLRDIAAELKAEGEQTEFISTASHEMRTPVASIEGYIGLALNPQTASIDERARGYLTQAHQASQHLGRLFQDLLDITRLDDKRIKVHLTPVNVFELVQNICDGHMVAVRDKGLNFTFGSDNSGGKLTTERKLQRSTYASVDVDFLREVVNNLIENAIKYTQMGGSIWVNVRGDSDQVLINVTDSGMGISADDLKHIFQKFYRVDNSQTRTIGGTGLGLYIVKARVEAMGGKVWAESSFGEGSTFYVAFPRLTSEEYERRKQIIENQKVMAFGLNRDEQGTTQGSVEQPIQGSMQPASQEPAQVVTEPNIPSEPRQEQATERQQVPQFTEQPMPEQSAGQQSA